MQNNSKEHRDRHDQKTTSVRDEPHSRDLRAEAHPVEEVAPAEVTKSFAVGVVTDCLKLNVREEPSADAEVLVIIDALSEVKVDMDASTKDFYKVAAAGVEGFCMRKYIALKK